MRTIVFTAALSVALAGISTALPTENDMGLFNFLSGRAAAVVSPDNTCGDSFAGANNSYSCDATTNAGGCCSEYGYCGNSTDYCSTGCQSAFGTCEAASTTPTDNNFLCGPANGGELCSGSLCCSQAGYCGNTTDYCGDGCQSAYGQCTPGASDPAPGGTCGPNFGGANCTDSQCCSVSGYCGNTEDYCADPGNCLLAYGRCDSDATPAGASTANVPRPLKGSLTYSEDIYDCVQSNVVALSYDDGPYNYTSDLLDILASYNFTATFFITGNNNGKGEIDITSPYPDLIQRMIAEGHQVASHTWSHYSLSNITQELRISQMVKNEMAFNNIIGMWPTYMRPPYSECSEDSGCWADLLALGYHRVYFDLDTQDYLNPLPTQIQNSKNIVSAALARTDVNDYLSIQHDIVQQSVTNLSAYYFDVIQAKGWKGVTVGECLGDDKANWYRSFNDSSSSTSLASTSTSVSSSKVPTSTAVTTSKPVTTSSTTSKPATTSTTSKPATTSTTSKTSSTSKPATTAPTSTSKVATSTSKASTTTSKVVTPTPTPSCAVQGGTFCGTIDTFTTKAGCQTASTDCYSSAMTCTAGGVANWAACAQYSAICVKLGSYCQKCGTSCNNAGFGY